MNLSFRELLHNLTFIGVVFHEFGHVLFCKLFGLKVFEFCYFRFGNPSGYVVHEKPTSFSQSFFVSVGPFISGLLISISCYALSLMPNIEFWLELLLFWIGASVALHSFPSKTDANVLWKNTNRHIFKNPFAIIGYPFVLLIWLADWLSLIWFDLIYAVVLYLFVINFNK